MHQLIKSLWGIEEAHAIRLKDQQMKLVPQWQQADSTSILQFKIAFSITIAAYFRVPIHQYSKFTIVSKILLISISSESPSLMKDLTASKDLFFLRENDSKDALGLESLTF